ncbi:DUF3027 domain-containing protein [Microbacterium terrisoli]|jgi:hypothetical protein|uniref:DUF3027 domain-containing protein n=1 Tax=Microbacterium terrisoli TaxID=3242192 RepID=UPI002804C4E1|nr:DUF3027 domain-containing protein [Microbacterium protaetiae]
MTSTPDERLLAAHDLARAALLDVTGPDTIGDAAGYSVEPDGVVSLRFANLMLGYPGWFWTVSLAVVEGAEPTVLEVELLPGDEALLAPDWVPWAERLAEFQAQQAAADAQARDEAPAAADGRDAPVVDGAAAAIADGDGGPNDAEDDDDDDLDEDDVDDDLDDSGFDPDGVDAVDDDLDDLDDEDLDDLDESEFDDDASPILHSGDLDGVDIDELDESGNFDDESE